MCAYFVCVFGVLYSVCAYFTSRKLLFVRGCVIVYRHTKERNINELRHNSMYMKTIGIPLCTGTPGQPPVRQHKFFPQLLYVLISQNVGDLLHHGRRAGEEEKTEIRVVSGETNLR